MKIQEKKSEERNRKEEEKRENDIEQRDAQKLETMTLTQWIQLHIQTHLGNTIYCTQNCISLYSALW